MKIRFLEKKCLSLYLLSLISGPLQESAIWIDESQTVSSNLRHGRPSSPLFSKDDEDPLGISDEGNQ